MSKYKKEKGSQGEREVKKILDEYGIEGRRQYASGSGQGEGEKGDFIINILDNNYTAEVKWWKNPAKTILNWLKGNDLLIYRGNNENYKVVMDFKDFLELIIKLRKERK